MTTSEKKTIPTGIQFALSGIAGCGATCVVQPLDLVKTRMQVADKKEYRSAIHCLQRVVSEEGFFALYKGVDAALLRQATYTTTRLGIYTKLNDVYRNQINTEPNFNARMAMGMVAGAIGAFVGTPAEVVLIRMTSDGRLPPDKRRNYSNAANALKRITKEEGAMALFSGYLPTVKRAIIVNMTQLGMYSQSKSFLKNEMNFPEGLQLHFMASMISGFLTTVTSLPLDIVKTRLQNAKGKLNGADVFKEIIKIDGPLGLWKGFIPYFLRIGPHTVLTLIFLETFNRLYAKYVLGLDTGQSGL